MTMRVIDPARNVIKVKYWPIRRGLACGENIGVLLNVTQLYLETLP